jgi:hypothetical protein
MQLPVLRLSYIGSSNFRNFTTSRLGREIALGYIVAAATFYPMSLAADEGSVVWLQCDSGGNSQTIGIDAANKQVMIYSASGTRWVNSVFRGEGISWSDSNDAFHGFINRQTLAYRFTIGPVRTPNAGGKGQCRKIASPVAGF